MKSTKTSSILLLTALLCPILLTGCSGTDKLKLINELSFSLDQISDLSIAYDADKITFVQGNGDRLAIREYMTHDRRRYYAKVKAWNKRIQIHEGKRPHFTPGFSCAVEVYLPKDYRQSLTITTTSGDIDLSGCDLELSSLRVDSTSGTVRIKRVSAPSISLSTTSGTLNLNQILGSTVKIETTSGSVTCAEVNGHVDYRSTSGNAEIKSAAGSGTYIADNSGLLRVAYKKVTGDLSLFNKNDPVELSLPPELSFDFEASSKNGTISVPFGENLTKSDQKMAGSVGPSPSVRVQIETRNGDVRVTQK